MNAKQSRQFLHLKIQSRINEAKCKALIDDKLLANLFSQDIQQMHYENTQNKVCLAYGHKKLSVAHKKQLNQALHLLKDTIHSDKKLLETVNGQIASLSDKEKDLQDVREETIAVVKEAIEYDCEPIIDETPTSRILNIDSHLQDILPSAPTDEISDKPCGKNGKKSISFGDVIIKTVDEVEEEKDKRNTELDDEDDMIYFHNNNNESLI